MQDIKLRFKLKHELMKSISLSSFLFLTRKGTLYFVAHYCFPGCISENLEYPGPKTDDIDLAMNVSPEWNKAIPLLMGNYSFCFVLRGIFLRNNVLFDKSQGSEQVRYIKNPLLHCNVIYIYICTEYSTKTKIPIPKAMFCPKRNIRKSEKTWSLQLDFD